MVLDSAMADGLFLLQSMVLFFFLSLFFLSLFFFFFFSLPYTLSKGKLGCVSVFSGTSFGLGMIPTAVKTASFVGSVLR